MGYRLRMIVGVSIACLGCSDTDSDHAGAGGSGGWAASDGGSDAPTVDAPSDQATVGEWPAPPQDASEDGPSESAPDGATEDTGTDTGTATAEDSVVDSHTLPGQLTCMASSSATVTLKNTGTTTWDVNRHQLAYVDGLAHPFVPKGGPTVVPFAPGSDVGPGQSATFTVGLLAPPTPASHTARFRMLLDGTTLFGATASQTITVNAGCSPPTDCSFPQGVPDPDFIDAATSYGDTDPAVDTAVNEVMVELSGCGVMSDCPITGFPGANEHEICQSWFAAVTERLRQRGYCAGQHIVGSTDEIAVSNTSCTGRWYGYHICNYGGAKVVWNPGARRGWWQVAPSWCL